MLQKNEGIILGKRKLPLTQKENQEPYPAFCNQNDPFGSHLPITDEPFVIHRRRKLFSNSPISEGLGAKPNDAPADSAAATLVVGSAGEILPQADVNASALVVPWKLPLAMPLGKEKSPENGKFTPVKKHVVSAVVGMKEGGINSGCVVTTPSGSRYMFKPMAGEKNSWSVWEVIHEIVAGNLFRLYLGKSKAPPIGICFEILPDGSKKFGVSSTMFTKFTQLASTTWRVSKPHDFEKIIVTSTFLGDPDPHTKNIGYNQDGEICKLDHGRAFLVEFCSGLEFLRYMIKVCEYNKYGYTLSLNAIKEQLHFIKSQGLDVVREMTKDAFEGLKEHCTIDELFPYILRRYHPFRWVDLEARDRKRKYEPNCSVQIKSWEQWDIITTTIMSSNFRVINNALEILTGMEGQGYEGIKIQLEGNAAISAEEADVKVCFDFNRYSASLQTDIKGEAYSRW